VIKELKKTSFSPSVSHIGARSHLCLHDWIRRSDISQQSRHCLGLRQGKKCEFGDDERVSRTSGNLLGTLLDLEEFVDVCREASACPYLCAQANSGKADVVLTPYTYIIDSKVRLGLGGCVVVFDEAHNLPEQCCDHFTSSLSMLEVQTVCGTISAVATPELLDLVRNGVNIDVDGLSDIGPRLVEFMR
jgi:Rad3-related DNA helicase